MNIWIIGASSGIGAALHEQLLQAGHQVYTASRRPALLQSAGHLRWDAASGQTPDTSFLPAVLHGLVYCPGSINLKPFIRLSAEDFLKDYRVNVLGAVASLQAAHRHLKAAQSEGGASVVLYSTVAVGMGMSAHASVAAAKGGVEGLCRSVAAEWASSNIRVNAIAPSLTDTPLAGNLLATPEKREASSKRHPLGRVGTAQELASITKFLLSPEASWMSGQILHADGGMSSLKML
ncbi:MAG: SDR family oxidoreductase [Cytophagales bacterium]|nr:MAG: SDR family oxidoreductase [Cytophagales bacterium]TAF62140.1 MAG: SDR family oxidoreductase [Cytophagales bacterium]